MSAAHSTPEFTPLNYFRELRLEELFPDPTKPLEVDLGCGEGAFLTEMAQLHPERNFLGVERLIMRVERTSRQIKAQGLTNARVLRLESAYVVGWLLPPASVSRLHLLCPDPWPKKKHFANRLVNDPDFLKALSRVLVPDGEFLLKTDDAPYYENALESLATKSDFEPLPWPDHAFPYAMTGFERQWLALSKTMHRARWGRLRG
jgi:tRNA (guanine-N7-)-methyltransferase